MDKLGINPILILAQIVNFGILLFLMKKFLYKPILKVLDERKKKAEEIEAGQEEMIKKMENAVKEEKDILSKAKAEADKLVNRAKVQGEKEREKEVQKGTVELMELRKKLEKEMEAEKAKMLKEVKVQAAEISALIAGKVIRESIDETKHKKLIDQAIKDLEKVVVH